MLKRLMELSKAQSWMSENTAEWEGRITLDGEGILILIKDQHKDSITLDSEHVLVLLNVPNVTHTVR